jgi:hypothetical protein
MVWWWWIPPALVGVVGLVLFLGGLGWLFRGKVFKGGRGLILGGLLLAVTAAVSLAALDVLTYRRMTYERPIATIELHQKGARLFDAVLTEPPVDAAAQPSSATYLMHGDEWRLEARVLKWKPWANMIGLNTQYRLDRLSGRYEDTESELHAERSVYDLRAASKNRVDLWKLARHDRRFTPMVDTLYGGGVFMPMADGAKYEVWLTQSGMIARPVNEAANRANAGGGWR